MRSRFLRFSVFISFLFFPALLFASSGNGSVPALFGIRFEFILFACTLIGVAVFHHQTMKVALIGLAAVVAFKLIFDQSFHFSEHFFGTNSILQQLSNKHMRQGEWPVLLNLFGLLLGFAILAKHFDLSKVPEILPRHLPGSWKGAFLLLVFVFVLSSFLDNIAGAMIGGTIAMVVFEKKVHIGYIAAIVAASNAGGSGSVIGDTTTTMMWIQGVSPLSVLHGYVGALIALFIFGIIASIQQNKYHPIAEHKTIHKIKVGHLVIVFSILVSTIMTNVLFDFPMIGVWVAIFIGGFFCKTPWDEIPKALPGSIFLMALVLCASLMPVNELPTPSWKTAFGLGFASAVFDNIPLTKLALQQGGFDWGMLAYTVGFGGSMIWFGSSSGVAITTIYPESRSVWSWLKGGWHVTVAYIIGFFVLLSVLGWNPK
jgi:Na+/H+ antiporter NhaD/arsenite permease-like protein